MNYSTIQSAREELDKYEGEYQKLVKDVNISLYTLVRTNFSSEEKNSAWRDLSSHAKNIISKVEKILGDLGSVRFSESEIVLLEEKEFLLRRYNVIVKGLRKEKETILRQIEKESIPYIQLREKTPNPGYCYFDGIRIAFPYELKKERQEILEIRVPDGAQFCSQECLMGYCKDYRDRENFRQEERRKNNKKIEDDRKLITEIQEKLGILRRRINNLSEKERDLELLQRAAQGVERRRIGFFDWIGQKLGLVKENNPRVLLEKVKKDKISLKTELERKEKGLQKALVIMLVDEQVGEEQQKLEKGIVHHSEKIAEKKEEKNN